MDEFERLVIEYGEHELLTAEEEIALAKRIEKGDLEAKDELITKNLRLVTKFASAYQHRGRPSADNLANGIDGLIRAAEKYDWRRGFKFSTYAVSWIKQSVRRGIDNTQETIRRPVHIEERTRKINRAQDALWAKLGREPTFEELADETEQDVATVEQHFIDSKQFRQITSLDQLVGEEGDTPLYALIPDEQTDTAQEVGDRATKEELRRLIHEELMPEEQAVIGHLYYNGNEGDRKSVAKALGKSLEEVKELEERAVGRLSEIMTGEPAEEAVKALERERPPETLDELKDAVWNYVAAYPDLTFAEIGQRLGVTARRANNYYHDRLKQMPDFSD